MNAADRARLTTALRDHVALVAADLRAQMQTPGIVRQRARKLHDDEQVGEDFEVWTDLLSRRAAVLWVLKSVYVRVLEDKGLLSPGRILDPEAQQLFERLAPNLGETAFLRWVYRDLASDRGGLPELFGPQPAEVATPADKLSRELLRFWRHKDADTGQRWSFAEERFDGELMGDLYQELDPEVKDRFALCQTPDFVREFMLDRTLTPAIEEFGAAEVRLLDPSCGSGHFLIDGLKRLVEATAAMHPEWSRRRVVDHCFERVVGIDLNDYACALARARLVMTAAELAGVRTLSQASAFHPHVYWADGLEQVERGKDSRGQQLSLLGGAREDAPRASLTRPEVRTALRKVLAPRFHAVVANPPYIVERDDARKAYHKEKVGGRQRYMSAYRLYSLASPFTERCFQLAVSGGFVGLITSNNFMKRSFGRPLIEQVLAGLDLSLVVDTSQAYIPHHGTPTVLLFGRNRSPDGDVVRAVMGKRGETGTPPDPSKGQVWTGVARGWDHVGYEDEFVSVAEVRRATFGKHPWSLRGGGAVALKAALEGVAVESLTELVAEVGAVAVSRADEVYEAPVGLLAQRVGGEWISPHAAGEDVRDWIAGPGTEIIFPYDEEAVARQALSVPAERWLWPFRTLLARRVAFGKTQLEHGLTWFEYSMLFQSRINSPHLISFANVATHNQFALIRERIVLNSKAPVIKLPATATEDDHLTLLGLLNSSTACFWMKQVFHCKGAQGINEGSKSELWEQFFEHDATKLKLFPIAPRADGVRQYARALDRLARQRAERSIATVLADAWTDAQTLRSALDDRRGEDIAALYRMVALQEELDWLCYRLYGLDDAIEVRPVDSVEPVPPTALPWALDLAAHDAAVREQIARGEQPSDIPTAWFERHRWEAHTEPPADLPADYRELVAARRARTREIKALRLVERAAYKRRWYRPDYVAEETEALATWLADRVEAVLRERTAPASTDQLTAALQDDPRILAVAEVLTGRRDFNLGALVRERLDADAVPNHPHHVYKAAGQKKRTAWERTWADQRREDAGERVTPDVPPKYTQADFLKPRYFRIRGKLDVPKERFIAFTEVPGRNGGDTLYGWAGWTPLQRVRVMLAIDEELEDEGVPLADRIALLSSAWRLLPDVAREDAAAASRLRAELQALVGADGPSHEMLEDWKERFPQTTKRRRRRAK